MELWGQVGGTPLVRLREGDVFLKLEYLNPGGSHKDRAVVAMLEDIADRYGPGIRIVESTSGSTGVSLALYGGLMGFEVHLVVKETASPIKVGLMKKMGAHVYVCPNVPPEDPRSTKSTVKRLEQELEAVYLNQNSNKANPRGQESLALEVLDKVEVDYFVMGVGTGGTITGAGGILKREAGTKIVAVTTKGSALAKMFGRKGGFEGGIDGFDHEVVPDNLDLSIVDEIREVSPVEATNWANFLVSRGILAGQSSGAHIKVAMELANQGYKVLTVAADHALFHGLHR